MSNIINKDLNNSENILNKFTIRYFGYNFTQQGITNKLYIKFSSDNNEHEKTNNVLNDKQIYSLSKALNNEWLNSFHNIRYSLFEMCIREFAFDENVGFNFIDTKDFSYISPQKIFEFLGDESQPLIDIVSSIEKNMFNEMPAYNPIFIIGATVNIDKISTLKSYIRFNPEELPTPKDRINLIKCIAKTINYNESFLDNYSVLIEKLEKSGLIFSFIGVDYSLDGSKRFKLYFKSKEQNNYKKLLNAVSEIISEYGLFDKLNHIFQKHSNGIWGIAISTDTFKSINGIQLYFYP